MYIGEQHAHGDRSGMPRLNINGQIRSTHDLISKEIAKRILSGMYASGDSLPNENDLIDEFRVSRTALRESLKTLAAKGLVIAKTKIGTKVLPASFWNYFDPNVLSWRLELGVDSEFLTKLYEVRQALEPAAAAMAATRRTPENLERMESCLDRMDKYHATRQTYAEPDLQFHQEILMASHNPFIQSFSSIIEASILCAFEVSAPIDSPERQAQSIQRHRSILEAIRDRQPAAASDAMSLVIVEGIENAHIEITKRPIVVSLPLSSSGP